ncbi:hypothetical protein HDU88_007861 [Geranomyces variabilis]|nr:hypothetical protein HDU88_007861 [Geranomyces variabilis]
MRITFNGRAAILLGIVDRTEYILREESWERKMQSARMLQLFANNIRDYRIKQYQPEAIIACVWVNLIISAVRDDSGELVGYSKVTCDFTERKTAEENVRAAYEESAKVKSEFFANMSHELRTPMNGAVAAAALLSETSLSDEQQSLTH